MGSNPKENAKEKNGFSAGDFSGIIKKSHFKGAVKLRTDKERRELIRSLNIMDDIFFQKIVEDKEVCEEILQVILQKPRLKVVEAQTQKFLRNIGTHSVILDLICQDEDGSHINVEVQKSDDDDHVKRVRFNISNIDTAFTERGIDCRELKPGFFLNVIVL